MCVIIEGKHIETGWGCCGCRSYNGLQRDECKFCGKKPCVIEHNGETLYPLDEAEEV